MRIIGGKDYYDNAISYGIDPNIVFVREKDRKISFADFPIKPFDEKHHRDYEIHFHQKGETKFRRLWNSNEFKDNDGVSWRVSLFVMIVCGKRIGGIKAIGSNGNCFGINQYSSEHALKFFYAYDEFIEWLDINNVDFYESTFRDMSIKNHFEVKDVSNVDFLIENKIVLAVYDYWKNYTLDGRGWWRINADILIDYHFGKFIEPFQLFQDISMFVGNMNSNENRMVKITDDKVKIAKHGFNKQSFRKVKGLWIITVQILT